MADTPASSAHPLADSQPGRADAEVRSAGNPEAVAPNSDAPDIAVRPLTWQTVVLMLGLTSVCLIFAGVLIGLGAVDPQQGTWCTVVIALALNGGVVLDRRAGGSGVRRMRDALTVLLDPRDPR
ncbi:hypothetical protein ACQP0C_42040 (plasmid) [Nocardia sp. CA-129566]|uniref:hypothetical protein n=1 Tax=Nocardia sp. CA-129566 TaxID=3239976 RepID=UPI003D997C05